MGKAPVRRWRAWLSAGASAAVMLAGAPARAEEDLAAELKSLRGLVQAQAQQLEAQRRALDEQGKLLNDQTRRIEALQLPVAPVESPETLETVRGLGASGPGQTTQVVQSGATTPPAPQQPVGEAPPPTSTTASAAAVTPALPEFLGVLTRPGHWVVEPQFEFSHASTNELIFRGVQIVPGLQVGVIDATTADRNTFSPALDVRTGLTRRIEMEVRVPYVWRHDQTQTLSQMSNQETITETVSNADLGDVELTGRFQLNSGGNGSPVWIASVDVKTATGLGPYDVPYDKYGVAQKLATGSGFWSIEPMISVLYPTDPVVLFASVGYVETIPRFINKNISTSNASVLIGRVEPGGSPMAAIGFAFALNDRFSFSLGYKHIYVRPTQTEMNHVWVTSQSLQVGTSTFGLSYRLTSHMTLSDNFEFGVTKDAPDMHMLTRLSFYF
jgi:hypothetical protein